MVALSQLLGQIFFPSLNPVITPQSVESEKAKSVLAVLLTIMATIIMAVGTTLTNLSKMEGNEVSLCLGLIAVGFGLTCFIYESQKTTPWKRSLGLSLLNGLTCGGLYSFCFFLSFDYITMGDSTTINYFSSFAASLALEMCFLKKKPHPLTAVAALLGFAGIIMICQPESLLSLSFDSNYVKGVLLSSFSGINGGFLYVAMQKFPRVPYSYLTFAYFSGCLLIPLPKFLSNNLQLCPNTISDRVYALSGSFVYFVAVYLAIIGSQLSLPSVSFVLKLLGIVVCYILQFLFLSQVITKYSLIGAALISISICVQSIVVIKLTNK